MGEIGWPFAGRTSELALLVDVLHGGRGGLIVGEAGIGKTALARRVASLPEFDRAVRIAGHAVAQLGPYAAFSEVVGDSGEGRAPERIAKLVRQSTRRGAQGPVLFVVDDIDVVDEVSLRVLFQLAVDGDGLVLGTTRGGQIPDVVSRLWREGLCERLDLGELSSEDTAAVLDAALGALAAGDVRPDVVRTFAALSGGNALLLRELVTAALTGGALQVRDELWTLTGQPPVPGGVREMIQLRLDQLPEPAKAGLELIAVGEPLPVSLATELSGRDVLLDVEDAGWVAVTGELSSPVISTAHPLYGEVLRARVRPLRGRELVLTIAGAIEAQAEPAPRDLVRAALWRLDHGLPSDPVRLLAAARAARGFSLETAERIARRVHDSGASVEATVLLAQVLTDSGRHAEATALSEALPPESLSPADRQTMAYVLAMGQAFGGGLGISAELVELMLAGEQAAADVLRGVQAVVLACDTRFDEARQTSDPVLNSPNAAARDLASLGMIICETWTGQVRLGADRFDELLAEAVGNSAGLPWVVPCMEMTVIMGLAGAGMLDEAAERARSMYARAESADDRFGLALADQSLGKVAMARGLPATATWHYRRGLAVLPRILDVLVRWLTALLAAATAAAGEPGDAREVLAMVDGGHRMEVGEPLTELAVAAIYAAEARLDEAAEHASWIASISADRQQWSTAVTSYHDAARYGAAQRVLEPMRHAAAFCDGPLAACKLAHVAALAANDPVALEQAAQRFAELGALGWALEATETAAAAYSLAGATKASRAARSHADALREQCEPMSIPWVPGAKPPPERLTAREREIALLAAAGHSNPEIAAMLFVTVGTVQSHLAAAYRKLNISSRKALADRLNRDPSSALSDPKSPRQGRVLPMS